MFDQRLLDYDVPDESKLLASVTGSSIYYYDGKQIISSRHSTYIDDRHKCLSVSAQLTLDDGSTVTVSTFDKPLPTKEVPRSYLKHVNQRILEDSHNATD